MNIEDIKNTWKKDMQTLEQRVLVNEEKIKQLELNKASTTFEKFLKVSLAGKNMALIYAVLSAVIMFKISDSPFFVVIVGIGAAAMLFSYFQHGPLKKLDLGSLGVVALQQEIYKFRMHTAKTAVYDLTIVGIWMATAGIGFYQMISGHNSVYNLATATGIGAAILLWFAIAYFGSKPIYRDIDVKLKESEDGLEALKNYKHN